MNRPSTYCIDILLIALLLSGCGSNNTDSIVPVIDIERNVFNMRILNLSYFSDNIRYIPLESNAEHQIFYNSGIISDFSENYIVDSDGKICILYDNKGTFIRQIGKQGRGPGEYTGISCVNLIKDKILLYDYHTDDLIEYNLEGICTSRYKSGFTGEGKYRMEYKSPILVNDSLIFGNIENRTGGEQYKALIIDLNGKVRQYYSNYIFFNLDPDVDHAKSPGEAIVHRFGEKIFFKEFLNDTLFIMNDKFQLSPVFIFNLGKYKQPFSERGKRWDRVDFFSYIDLDNIFQTKEYLFLKCDFNKYFPAKRLTPEIIRLPGVNDFVQWFNTTSALGVYNKTDGNLEFVQPSATNNHLVTSGLFNDLDAGPRFMPDKMINDSTMMMKIRMDLLITHVESDDFKNGIPKYPEKKKRLENLVDSLKNSEYDNPVLMLVTFKCK